MKIPAEDFATAVRSVPLVSIDLLLQNHEGRYLFGWRENRPAQNCWFVPGGRIHKGETLAEAFTRTTRDELGIELDFADAQLRGAYDHIYDDNFAGDPTFGTHYVTLGWDVKVGDLPIAALPSAQHARWRYLTLDEIRTDPDVHPNARKFFL